MPWVAKLRGPSVATPSAIPCVEGAEALLRDVGKGTAEAQEEQWRATALGRIAQPQARSRRTMDGDWVISREELTVGLRRWHKQLLIRTGSAEEAGVTELGARYRAATLAPGQLFTDEGEGPEPHVAIEWRQHDRATWRDVGGAPPAARQTSTAHVQGAADAPEGAGGGMRGAADGAQRRTEDDGGAVAGNGNGDPAMDAAPDEDVERAARLCAEMDGGGGVDGDEELLPP
eukprot:gene6718-1079_t